MGRHATLRTPRWAHDVLRRCTRFCQRRPARHRYAMDVERKNASLMHPPLPDDARQRRYWQALPGSANALAIAAAAREHAGIVVAVTRDTQAAHALESDLRVFATASSTQPALDVLHFPDWDTLPYDLFPPHPEIVSQRIAVLYRLPATTRGVLVVPVATLMQRLAPRSFIG